MHEAKSQVLEKHSTFAPLAAHAGVSTDAVVVVAVVEEEAVHSSSLVFTYFLQRRAKVESYEKRKKTTIYI